jgi:hypothetical protein
MFIGIMGRSWTRRCWRARGWTRTRYSLSIRTQGSSCRHRAIMRIVHQDGRVPITVTAAGTPADCRSVRDRERATRTNRGGYRTAPRGADGRPERADLYSMRRWRPPSERRKYSAICSPFVTNWPVLSSRSVIGHGAKSVPGGRHSRPGASLGEVWIPPVSAELGEQSGERSGMPGFPRLEVKHY